MLSSLNLATEKETSQSIFKEAVHFILRHTRETTDATIMWFDERATLHPTCNSTTFGQSHFRKQKLIFSLGGVTENIMYALVISITFAVHLS